MKKTYTQVIGKEQNSLLWAMSLESARVYNKYISLYNELKDFKLVNKVIEKEVPRKYLYSQSFQGAYQQAQE
jgi:hypothetical protein